MMNFFRKYQFYVLYSLLAFFILSIAINFGPSLFVKGGPNETVVEVDGQKVPLRLFYSHYDRALEQLSPEQRRDDKARAQKRDEALRDLVQGVVFDQLAKHYAILVPDNQVIASLAQIPAFQSKGQFDPQLYLRGLQQLRTTPQDFEEEQRRAIGFYKLRWLVSSAVKVTNQEAEMAWTVRGAEFAKANEYETDASGKKTGKRRSLEDLKSRFRDELWQEKVMWAFNQWFLQIGQKTHVKTHLDVIEGGAR